MFKVRRSLKMYRQLLGVLKKPLFILWFAGAVFLLFNMEYVLHSLQGSITSHTHHHVHQYNIRNPEHLTGEINKKQLTGYSKIQMDEITGKMSASIGKRTIKIPDISDVLTHLKNKANTFEPVKKVSKGRKNVTLTIGIPHVNRKVAYYLDDTLKSLLNNLKKDEMTDCLIIVFLCDADRDYNEKMLIQIQKSFPDATQSGLLELIIPPLAFYPDIQKLAETSDRNGDSIDRWKWRSRENLDAAFLMNYAYPKGKYYLMSEDDVTTVKDYFTNIKQFTSNPPRNNWYILGFSEYGSKGILFRSRDCPMIVNFLLTFYGAWPVDWLLDDFLIVWGCRSDQNDDWCSKHKNLLRLDYPKRLFHHIGFHSSLKGKIMNDVAKH